MKDNIFLPRLNNLSKDSVNEWLQTIARSVFILVFGLLLIFFIPNAHSSLSLGFTKTYLVIVGVSLTLVLLALSILRRGLVRFSLPLALGLFWLFALMSLASSLLSDDKLDSIYGNNFEVQTAGFFILMATVMTTGMILGRSKSTFSKFMMVFGFTTIILLLIQICRLIFGPTFLSFGVFTTNTSSWLGGFNDLALFSGLIIIVLLILFQGATLPRLGKVVLTTVIILSLVVLAVINFSFVWYLLSGFSLLMLLYLLSKDTWLSSSEEKNPLSVASLGVTALVVLVSFIFIIGGSSLGSKISNITGINYLEVRPSVEATFDVVKAVYTESALFGAGPNRFEDAWRLYKDPVINQTYFWSTDFTAGSGFVPTVFATTGLAGSVFIVLFLLAFIYSGYRTLFVAKIDQGWYLIGLITFVSAVYLWIMSIFYVPGSAVMLLMALMNGFALAVYVANNLSKNITLNVAENKHYGFVLIALVLLVVISSAVSVFKIGKQYFAQVTYAELATSDQLSLPELDQRLQDAEYLFAQDIFTAERARLRLMELNRLVAIVEPTTLDQQAFQNNLIEGIALSEKAINLDPTNAFNHALLASFYGLLDVNQAPEIKNRKEALLAEVLKLDPKNPSYLVLFAQLSAKQRDFVTSRSYLNDAIKLKNDYTDALLLLSQIEIEEGQVESAIKVTNSLIAIEPNNPIRYFQLGVLLAESDNLEQAVRAFQEAVRLDNSYANARYFLALVYLDLNKKDEALVELRSVLSSNPDNQEIKNLISQVEAGEFTKTDNQLKTPVIDGDVVSTEEDVTISNKKPDTDLITPLNQTEQRAENVEETNQPSPDSVSVDTSEVTE
ncbi:MAG: tetratricopeptide repeat protein [Candidatus Pacebacteria bacterium]|nr:tetratricopeptide repeat protein [Candidatus Paceibacterota bacterium]